MRKNKRELTKYGKLSAQTLKGNGSRRQDVRKEAGDSPAQYVREEKKVNKMVPLR